MNQVIGCVYSFDGEWKGSQIEAITLYHLGSRSDTLPQKFRVSGETTNWIPGLLQSLEETPSDIASGSSQQD